MRRTANAAWNGSLKDGSGTLGTQSHVLHETPYSFRSRFGDGKETNPEELIAAQAKSGCPVSKVLRAEITLTAVLEA